MYSGYFGSFVVYYISTMIGEEKRSRLKGESSRLIASVFFASWRFNVKRTTKALRPPSLIDVFAFPSIIGFVTF
jgi:hypothetical protein